MIKTGPRILIIPDSFKDSISSIEFCEIANNSVLDMNSNSIVDCIPMGDGGEGSIDVFRFIPGYDFKSVIIKNPIGKEVPSEYCIQKETNTAIIEMAKASGLQMLPQKLRDPMKTTSYGTGQLILDAVKNDIKKIILFVGGSATNDIGIGMLEALGYKYYNSNNERVSGIVENIENIVRIDNPKIIEKLKEVSFVVACDVSNTLLGPGGATYSYGKQKGANNDQLDKLEKCLKRFSDIARKHKGVDHTNSEGAGAAGGVGFSAMSFLDAKFQSGFKLIQKLIDLKNKIQQNNYDLIITGEGSIDKQTSNGKLIMHLGKIGKKYSIPVIAFGGIVKEKLQDLNLPGITGLKQISPDGCDLSIAIQKAPIYLDKALHDEVQKYLN
jgi:glycerate kinase